MIKRSIDISKGDVIEFMYEKYRTVDIVNIKEKEVHITFTDGLVYTMSLYEDVFIIKNNK